MIIDKYTVEKLKKVIFKYNKKILYYHMDTDGVCSAALWLKFFSDFKTYPIEGPFIDEKIINTLRKFNLIVFLDLPMDQLSNTMISLKGGRDIVIIDHHNITCDMNKNGIIHINPRFKDKFLYVSNSHVVYNVLEHMNYFVKQFCWIAVIGVIGDYAMKGSEKILKVCNLYFPEFKENMIFKISEMISHAITLKGKRGAERCVKILVNARSYRDFMLDNKIWEWSENVEREIERIVCDFERNAILHKDVDIFEYEIKSRMNITSLIASILFSKNPEKTIVIRKKVNGKWKISMRSNKYDLNVVARVASAGIGMGGGHKNAAGAMVNNYKEFLGRMIKLVKTMNQNIEKE